MSHQEVFWVSMQARSLILKIEKLRPRESTRFAQVTEQSWDTTEDLKAVSLRTPFPLTHYYSEALCRSHVQGLHSA